MSPQKRATIVASSVALLLVLVKFMIGVASGSVAVLASAIDSLLDMIISVFNFFAIKKSEEKATDRFQYGKGKVQAIAAVIEGTVITLSGFYIIYEAIKKAVNGGETTLVNPAIMVMIFSIGVTFLLVEYLMRVAKQTDNIVIKSDALHYKTDLLTNGVILFSLVIVSLTGWDMVDAIFGFGIGIYIIYSAYGIIKEGIYMLLDHALDAEVVNQIESKIDEHPLVNSHHWLKTRTDGSNNYVEFHLVLEPDMTLLEAHRISDQIEERIMRLDERKVWIITPHYDPYDDEEINNMNVDGHQER
ncbi:MAG TPA: cation transporter [Campylobacterales bacterium]|nr:cation transporter [Campylobacterales bacterium]HIP41905.1 cation transporter [Campylobacterales bacterium]